MAKKIIVGVDIRDLRRAKTGTKTYLEELVNQFRNNREKDIEFVFIDTIIPVYSGNNKLLKLTEHLRFQLWKQLILPVIAWSKNCDVLLCTDTCVPLMHLGYKTIPVIHDAFTFENPENYGKLWLRLYNKTAIPAAERSVFVVTPSLYSKKQLGKFTDISADRLIVIPEGPKSFKAVDAGLLPELLTRLGLKPQGYLLHVGSMFKRKNLVSLINAFKKIKDQGYPDLKLVLAGSPPSQNTDNDYDRIQKAINDTGLINDVVLTGYLSDDELAAIYQGALLYVFPSVNEGFGIPVLEAFQYNLPVLIADNTCLPEIGGDAVVQFNPFDVNEIAAKIKDVLDSEALRKEMVLKSQERLKHFSWENTAQQFVELFRRAV